MHSSSDISKTGLSKPFGRSEPSRGVVLRGLVKQGATDGTISIYGTPIALMAKLAEQQGCEAIYLSGATLSAGVLGVPDIGIVTLEQLIEHTRVLAGAVSIPLVVDADTGFGGSQEVGRCVRLLEEAGAAAIQLEDQRRPKRCGHLAGKEIIDVEEMCKKIAAAATARRDQSTVIIARSDARGVTDLDDCVHRLRAYHEAGADWLFPEALVSRDEFARVGRECAVGSSGQPAAVLMANMTEFGVSPLLSRDDLSALGFAVVLYPVTLLRIAMKAVEAGLAVIDDEGSQSSLLDLMQSREELYDLLGYDPAHPEAWTPQSGPTTRS